MKRKKVMNTKPISSSTIYVPCYTPDIAESEREMYSLLWRMDADGIKKFFKNNRKVSFKKVPIEVCVYKSTHKNPLSPECFNCSKWRKYLPKNRKKIKLRKTRKKIRSKL